MKIIGTITAAEIPPRPTGITTNADVLAIMEAAANVTPGTVLVVEFDNAGVASKRVASLKNNGWEAVKRGLCVYVTGRKNGTNP